MINAVIFKEPFNSSALSLTSVSISSSLNSLFSFAAFEMLVLYDYGYWLSLFMCRVCLVCWFLFFFLFLVQKLVRFGRKNSMWDEWRLFCFWYCFSPYFNFWVVVVVAILFLSRIRYSLYLCLIYFLNDLL